MNHHYSTNRMVPAGVLPEIRNGGCFGGLDGGVGGKAPASEGWGSGDKALSRRRHGGLKWNPQRSKILHFLQK